MFLWESIEPSPNKPSSKYFIEYKHMDMFKYINFFLFNDKKKEEEINE